jgi:putative transposase
LRAAAQRSLNEILITYKFRIYPDVKQEKSLNETIETCKRLYNKFLADRNEYGTGFYVQKRRLVSLKRDDKYLKAVFSQVLQDVVLRLDKAFQAFFKGIMKYPKFRRYGRYNSFSYPQSGFELKGSELYLSKLGKLKIVLHRKISGAIKRVTIIRDIDQWFVAFAVVEEKSALPQARGTAVGIDRGLLNLVALNDGTVIENPHFLNKSVEKIKFLQRNLSRKEKGSRNRDRARIQLAKAWRKVRRQRDDFCHKLSNDLAMRNNIVVFEYLKILNMVKNHNFASAIMDANWGKLRVMTAYKAERRRGRAKLVDPSGSSQTCSRCDWVLTKKLTLRDRLFHCERCGLTLDRDVNAARNILKWGFERSLVEIGPLLITRIASFSRGSKKPLNLFLGSSQFVAKAFGPGSPPYNLCLDGLNTKLIDHD